MNEDDIYFYVFFFSLKEEMITIVIVLSINGNKIYLIWKGEEIQADV